MDNEKVIYKDSSGILFSNGQSCIYRSHGNEISLLLTLKMGVLASLNIKIAYCCRGMTRMKVLMLAITDILEFHTMVNKKSMLELIKAEDSLIYEEAIPFNDNAKHRIVYNMKRKKEEHYVINQSLIIQLDKFAKFDTYSDFNSFSVIYEIDSDIVIHYEKAKHITNSMGLLMPDYKEERIKKCQKMGKINEEKRRNDYCFSNS